MTSPNARPAPEPQRVRPYAMTGGRTRPTHDDLEIETLVSTNSTGEEAPKLTVEQRAIAALCRDIAGGPRSASETVRGSALVPRRG